METPLVLDTDILIELMRGNPEIIDYVSRTERTRPLATTTINLFELFHGAFRSRNPAQEFARIDSIKEVADILTLTPESAKRAGAITAALKKQGQQINVKDVLIGAIAATNGFALKTGNRRDFERIPGLTLAP